MLLPDDDGAPAPALVTPLTMAERRRARLVGLLPVCLAFAVFATLAAVGRATVADILLGTLVYGGLLGLAAWVVAHERAAASHCPRCGESGSLRRPWCEACGQDLRTAPRVYRCEERHQRYLDPGLCDCGRRLREFDVRRGLDRELRRTLWSGVWLAAFLVGTVLLIRLS